MELTTFLSIFALVFIGEFGDKTQFAAGTGTLANRGKVRIIFASSVLALVTVSGLTTFAAGFIPESVLPNIILLGGLLLIGYGTYLFSQAGNNQDNDEEDANKKSWKLFFSQFWIVFIAELGDKTQVFTAGAAVKNQEHLLTVFAASALALTAVTTLTVWGITKIPQSWAKPVQRLGAVGMILYGIYMVIWPG